MSSALYECRIVHERFSPRRHRFAYRVFAFSLDLDEIDALVSRIPWLSRNRFNLYAFHDDDHLDVRALLREHGIAQPPHRIQLITNLRILGYVFNPVSFYFCFDETGEAFAAVAEVSNTFRETKPYVIGAAGLQKGRFESLQRKDFYISPFIARDADLRLRLAVPGRRLGFVITDLEKGTIVLEASMTGSRVPLTAWRLAWFAVKYPLLTLRVIAAIHWQALRLWLKNVPFHRKSDRTRGEGRSRDGSGLYRRAVFSALRPMRHGSLTMTMPNGETFRFGDGSNPRGAQFGLDAHVRVLREDFFRRCFYFGDIGLAEAYMAGDWSSDDLAEVVSWFILNAASSGPQSKIRRRVLNWLGWINNLGQTLRANSVKGSRANIAAHYDLSNELFALFLDPSMTYSSALFQNTGDGLEEAQYAKYRRLCALLELKPGDRVLEIGGGWGSFSRFVAKQYGCHVTTITISEQQFAWADRLRREEALEKNIDLRLLDYRELTGRFDKIVSIEMLEAVGHEYLDAFFAKCNELLAPNGLVALQVITCPEARYESVRGGVDFIQKHIFPGGLIPSVGALLDSVQRVTDFTMRDLFDLGDSYARTLQLWSERFEARLESVRALGFDDVFIRKWRYYLMYCLAAFRMRHVSVVQMLLTRHNNHSLATMRNRP